MRLTSNQVRFGSCYRLKTPLDEDDFSNLKRRYAQQGMDFAYRIEQQEDDRYEILCPDSHDSIIEKFLHDRYAPWKRKDYCYLHGNASNLNTTWRKISIKAYADELFKDKPKNAETLQAKAKFIRAHTDTLWSKLKLCLPQNMWVYALCSGKSARMDYLIKPYSPKKR